MLIPNSFQMPNAYVDLVLVHLTGVETKVLLYVARMTFGWQKTDEYLPIEQIVRDAGVGRSQAFAALARLAKMQVISKLVNERRIVTYALQLDPARFLLPGEQIDDEAASHDATPVRKSDCDEVAGGVVQSENDHSPVRKRSLASPKTITPSPYTLNPLPETHSQQTYSQRGGRVGQSENRSVPKPAALDAAERAACPVHAAMVEVAGGEPLSSAELATWDAARRDAIARALAAGQDLADLADEYRERGARYRRIWPHLAWSAVAVWRHWTTLATEPTAREERRGPRGGGGQPVVGQAGGDATGMIDMAQLRRWRGS